MGQETVVKLFAYSKLGVDRLLLFWLQVRLFANGIFVITKLGSMTCLPTSDPARADEITSGRGARAQLIVIRNWATYVYLCVYGFSDGVWMS